MLITSFFLAVLIILIGAPWVIWAINAVSDPNPPLSTQQAPPLPGPDSGSPPLEDKEDPFQLWLETQELKEQVASLKVHLVEEVEDLKIRVRDIEMGSKAVAQALLELQQTPPEPPPNEEVLRKILGQPCQRSKPELTRAEQIAVDQAVGAYRDPLSDPLPGDVIGGMWHPPFMRSKEVHDHRCVDRTYESVKYVCNHSGRYYQVSLSTWPCLKNPYVVHHADYDGSSEK